MNTIGEMHPLSELLFVAGVISWMESAEDSSANAELVRTITVDGTPKFEIILKPLQ